MKSFKNEKELVRKYNNAMESSSVELTEDTLRRFTGEEYNWKGVYPFREQIGVKAAAETFWMPLKESLSHMQRRQDIFIAGNNEIDGSTWVMSMGNFMGLFDKDFLGIPHTQKMINLRYAEFSCVENEKITKTGLFVDIIGFMKQAGLEPLPPETAQSFVYPGPRDHNGLLFEDAPEEEGQKTLAVVNQMVNDLSELNKGNECPPDLLRRTWDEDMIWYGPSGTGATYTIPRYQKQCQIPFRKGLTGKKFNGHVCRFAEGKFACFFGWPNLTNTPLGGYLGLPGGNIPADMQVVDVYYRRNEKLTENWVFIDIPYWLKQQGVDIIERTCSIVNPK